MTKAEIIARYGEAYYTAHVDRCKAKLKAKYASMSHEERTAEYVRRKGYVESWVAAHPEQSAALHRKHARTHYHAKSPEEKRALYEKRMAARKAKLATDRTFADAQAAKQSTRFQRYSAAHPGVVNARSNAWSKANPEKKRAMEHNRRAAGKMDPDFVKFLREQPCLDCGKAPTAGRRGRSEIGHLIPVKRGGTNNALNLVAQCRSCNAKQNARFHPRFAMINYPQAAAYATAAA